MMETEKLTPGKRKRVTKHTLKFQHDKDEGKSQRCLGWGGDGGQGLAGSRPLMKTSQLRDLGFGHAGCLTKGVGLRMPTPQGWCRYSIMYVKPLLCLGTW